MSTHIAEGHIQPSGLPTKCQACNGQYPSRRHIDFDAACDRGFYGDNAAQEIVMDDLILCDECVGEGARLLGWAPRHEIEDRMASLEYRLAEAERREVKATEYADRMEEAFQARPERLKVSRPRGRPPKHALAGVEMED